MEYEKTLSERGESIVKRKTKVWLLIGFFLISLGLIVSVVTMAMHGFDFSKFNTVKYQTNTHIIKEEFDGVAIVSSTADVVFEKSENGKNEVIFFEKATAKHTVLVENGRLTIKEEDNSKWYENIGVSFSTTKLRCAWRKRNIYIFR